MFTTQEQAANCGITVTPKFNLQIAFSMLMATQVERCPVVFFFIWQVKLVQMRFFRSSRGISHEMTQKAAKW